MREGKRRGRLTPARRRVIDKLVDQWLDADPEALKQSLAQLQQRAPRIASWVARLLEASREPTSYLQTLFQRAGDAAGNDAHATEIRLPTGTRLGPWRLTEHVGQGGMGAVYRAERADGAFAMQVAIKLIRLNRPGLNDRLESERRLLARLDHRHIARLIDGGTSEDGLAFLVMEWVNGEDLDRFVQRVAPAPHARLDLFEQIAEAVAHAHQRRVVHGDLKPANIRVTERGKARLLDFGVARLIEQDSTVAQEYGRGLTPAYSAPEQLDGEAATTLSDVWSLGTLLRWMLDEEASRDGPTPSESDHLPGNTPRRADLEAIIARARADKPEARYHSVAQLLEDLRRYRNCEAVLARRATRGYVTQRFIQRHRLWVAVGMAACLGVGMALVGMAWLAHQATQERNLAQIERDRAEAEVEKTRQVSDFVVALFRQANPSNHRGEELTAKALARLGVDRVENIDASPEIQADFLLVLSQVEQALGDYAQAVMLAERAVGMAGDGAEQPDHQLARIHSQLGASLTAAGAFDEAASAHRQALDLLGDADPALRAEILSSLGISLRRLGRFEDAIEVLEQALEYTVHAEPGSTSEATARNNLAIPLARTGRIERAGEMFQGALMVYRNTEGNDHPLTATALANLGAFFLDTGQLDDAEISLRESLDLREQLFGPNHPQVANSRHALGRVALARGELEAAETWFIEATEIRRQALGEDHFALAPGLLNLAIIATRQDQFELAETHIERAAALYDKAYDANHPVFAVLHHVRGDLAMARGNSSDALEWHQRGLTLRRNTLDDDNPDIASSMLRLAQVHRERGDDAEASRWTKLAEQFDPSD